MVMYGGDVWCGDIVAKKAGRKEMGSNENVDPGRMDVIIRWEDAMRSVGGK